MTTTLGFRMVFLSAVLAAGAALAGCEAPGVGDPCAPEQVPTGGFAASEAYLETSSVQCRSRVCMVYHLAGDPNKIIGTPSCPGGDGTCVDISEIQNRVYCSCRCAAPDDPGATLCECPDGYSCEEVLKLGGPGIRGSYCVKNLNSGGAEG